uniref:Uncharacterized protein n=1 Tax=Rhizophora mucronata TaxID=61149 RepID=A0A2P2QQI1_RHIMU
MRIVQDLKISPITYFIIK